MFSGEGVAIRLSLSFRQIVVDWELKRGWQSLRLLDKQF